MTLQISDMIDSLTDFPSGAFVPFVVTSNVGGLVTTRNYRYNAGLYLAKYSTLAADGGAALIGSTGGVTVQAALDARPTSPELAASDGSTLVGTELDTTGAVPRTVAEKLGDFVNVLDFQVNPASADITDALEKAIYQAFPTLTAIQLFIPAGEWIVSRQIIPGRQVTICGAGIYATTLFFTNVASANATMKGAFSIGDAAALTAYDPAFGSKVQGDNGARYSTFQNLAIARSGTAPANFNYAIWAAGRVFCQNVRAETFGYKIAAGTQQAGVGTITGNANQCQLISCISLNAPEHGFYIDGADANACSVVGCDAFQPVVNGFYEASFLGNSYVGCHASATSGTSCYKAVAPAGVNRSSFVGCYAEAGGTLEWDVASPSIILSPKGAMPVVSSGKSVVHGALGGITGHWLTGALRLAPTEALAFSIGDASNVATDVGPGLIRMRATDTILYSINGGGAGLEILSGASSVVTFTAASGVSAAGRVASATYLKSGSYTVATLPAAATAGVGARAMVTDANATTFLSTVAGGGANIVPVVSDGTNWKIA